MARPNNNRRLLLGVLLLLFLACYSASGWAGPVLGSMMNPTPSGALDVGRNATSPVADDVGFDFDAAIHGHGSQGKSNYDPELTFTNLGWFQENETAAKSVGRFMSSKSLVDAVVAHPRYNPKAWSELSRNPDRDRPIVAFLDVETCGEVNWPGMGGSVQSASDVEDGRASMRDYLDWEACSKVRKALNSSAMAAPESRLIVMSCFPDNPLKECLGAHRGNRSIYDKLVVAHEAAHESEALPSMDMGIPPLPIKPVTLNETELDDLKKCRERRYLFSFTGRGRGGGFVQFERYFEPLHDKSGVYAKFHMRHYEQAIDRGKLVSAIPEEEQSKDGYYELLRNSRFAGAPRGDNLYSYRFSEVLSAGAIPVVYADRWVLPYTSDVVDWEDMAVLIPQRKVNETMDILKGYSPERVCGMQRNALRFYDEYVRDGKGRVRGILKALRGRLRRDVDFSTVPG